MPAASPPLTDTSELSIEYNACFDSVAYFLDHYARISDPQAGIMPFHLWDFQRDLLDTLNGEQRVIVLKARQLGVSWLMAGYALWVAMFQDGANVLMLSKRLDEAVTLLDKCEHIFMQLPAWLQPKVGKRNETTLQFERRGSKITALPATEDAGRSESASLVIVDEAAFHPAAEANYSAYKPTVDAGGKLIIVSTANGRGNWYHQMWSGAPANGFTPVFLPWTLRPGRDGDWWARQQAEYGAMPYLLAQEYPLTSTEAFVSSGACLFDLASLQELQAMARSPLSTADNGALQVWQRPRPSCQYVVGADVAEGTDAGNDRYDYDAAVVLERQTGVHVASLHGQWPLDQYARLLRELATQYNHALLGVERNNHGHAVLEHLLHNDALRYDNVYRHDETDPLRDKHGARTYKAGWPTTAKTKPLAEQEIAAWIKSGSLVNYDAGFWDECLSYVRHGDGKTGHQGGCHDDRVLAHMIALQMRQHVQAGQMLPISVAARWRS